MSVWVCVPSKRPPAEVEKWAQAWRDMGYKIALWRDASDRCWCPTGMDYLTWAPDTYYPGYSTATNYLISHVAAEHLDARWFVIGGDDVWPDTTKRADEIAAECEGRFTRLHYGDAAHMASRIGPLSTFGVMQPTGDRWGDSEQMRDRYGANRGAYIDRIAGSAWIGREFALRAYGGNGPLWPEYVHMFPDEELQCVAEKLGVFWQRPDLTQVHQHWARGDNKTRVEHMPQFLTDANTPEHWDKYKTLFERRKAMGFPGHEVKV